MERKVEEDEVKKERQEEKRSLNYALTNHFEFFLAATKELGETPDEQRKCERNGAKTNERQNERHTHKFNLTERYTCLTFTSREEPHEQRKREGERGKT